MSNDTTSADKTGGGLLPFHAVSGRKGDKLQIDMGDYLIILHGVQVGEVYVESDPGYPGDATRTIEHWCLFSSYTAPGPTHTRVGLEFTYRTGVFASATDFLAYVRKVDGARYIKSTCQEMAP